MRRTPVVLGVIALIGALAVTADVVALRTEKIDPAADLAALARNLEPGRGAGSYSRGFDHLIEGLPNATHLSMNARYSDSVVVGTITDVARHTGVIDIDPAPELGRPDFTNQTVPFDAPRAHWRNLKVTVTVTDVLAGEQVKTLVVDWPVMGPTDGRGSEDADAIGRALKDLGTVMITSRAHRPNTIGGTRQLTDPATGVAQVAADGALSFPFTHESGAAFAQGIDTVEKVRTAAAKPTWKAPPPAGFAAG